MMPPALSDVSSASVAVVVVLTAAIGALWWLWRVRGLAMKARDDLAAHIAQKAKDDAIVERRLAKVEDAAANLKSLADAVKFGAEATSAQIANLAERMAEHAAFSKDQFNDLKQEQKTLRQAMDRRNTRRAVEG